MKRGFTLVEILVVIAVLAIAGLLVLYIFTNSLRASNKAQILSSIKKNGQAVLETMDKSIRNAKNVVCISNSGDTIVIDNWVKYIRYRFTGGKIQQEDLPKPSSVPASDPKYSQSYLCSDPSVSPITLSDTNPQTGVLIQNGLFTLNKSAGFKDTVTIKFEVTYPAGVYPALVGQIDPVNFATTVQLRNIR